MKIQPYVEKLEASQEYKDFISKYGDAYMVAGFFVLDLEGKHNVHQIDFFVPSENKIAAFSLDEGVKLKLLDMMHPDKSPEKLDMRTEVDLEALEGILEDGMKNRNMSEDVKKIIAVVQNIEGKKIWNLNCVLSGMEILKAHIEDESKSVLKMEKASVMDYIKTMNPEQLQKMQAQMKAQQAGLKGQMPGQVMPQPPVAEKPEDKGPSDAEKKAAMDEEQSEN